MRHLPPWLPGQTPIEPPGGVRATPPEWGIAGDGLRRLSAGAAGATHQDSGRERWTGPAADRELEMGAVSNAHGQEGSARPGPGGCWSIVVHPRLLTAARFPTELLHGLVAGEQRALSALPASTCTPHQRSVRIFQYVVRRCDRAFPPHETCGGPVRASEGVPDVDWPGHQ